jgi:L-rhamnose mutarotase
MDIVDGSGLVGRRLMLHPTAAVVGPFDVPLQFNQGSWARCSYGPRPAAQPARIQVTDIQDLLARVLAPPLPTQRELSAMQRTCFLLKIKSAKIEEYKRSHREVWPQMLHALRETGWRNYSLFLRDDGLLVGISRRRILPRPA